MYGGSSFICAMDANTLSIVAWAAALVIGLAHAGNAGSSPITNANFAPGGGKPVLNRSTLSSTARG